MAWYRSGTLSVTNGSTSVTGAGTSWIAGAGIGEALYAPDGRIYEIANISSNTSLTLATAYLGATQSAQSYTIIPSQSYIRDLAADAAALISQYAGIASGAGAGKFTDGSAATPGIAFSSDVDTGIYRASTNTLGIAAGGVSQMTVNTSGANIPVISNNPTLSAGTANGVAYLNGSKQLVSGSGLVFDGTNFGVGTTTPLGKLTVTAAAPASTYDALVLQNTDNSFSGQGVRLVFKNSQHTGAEAAKFGYISYVATSDYSESGAITFGTNSGFNAFPEERARISANGNFGIGTRSPTAKLEVSGDFVRFYNPAATSNGNATTTITHDKPFVGWTNVRYKAYSFVFNLQDNVDAMQLDASGNLLVGTTTNPAESRAVVVRQGATKDQPIFQWSDGENNTGYLGIGSPAELGTEGALLYSDGALFFGRRVSGSFVESARIHSNGSLLVGTSAPITGGSNCFLPAGITVSDVSVFARHLASDAQVRCVIASAPNYSGNDGYFYIGSRSTGDTFFVRTNGDVTNLNNSYGAMSDVKVKENITDATPKLEKLNQVRVVNYNLVGDAKKQIGVVAQELEQIFPGLVEESIDLDSEGNNIGTTTKSVKYSVFVPMLIKALQEQQALIEDLRSRVAALETN